MDSNLTIFIVAGALDKSLTASKIIPIVSCKGVRKIFVFTKKKGNEINGVRYITLPIFITKIKFKFIYKIFRFVFEPLQLLAYSILYKPDYINGIYTLPCGLESLIISKIIRCKSIISVIGGEIEIKTYYKFTSFWENFNLWMLRNCDIVTTTGSKVTNFLIDNSISKNKIFEYPGSVDTLRFNFKNYNEKDIDILFVGTFRRLKGPDRVLKIVYNLLGYFPNIKSCFLGNGYLYNTIKEEVKSLHMENNVSIIGYVNNPEQYYQRSKVLIMPSRSEGLSMAMLEAMSCGCVPVVSNVGNMTDAAWHNINAMVVEDYMDIDTFTKYAKELLVDKTKWESLSIKGCQLVREKYSVEAQAEIFENILRYGENI